jgi:hypothetical protein
VHPDAGLHGPGVLPECGAGDAGGDYELKGAGVISRASVVATGR